MASPIHLVSIYIIHILIRNARKYRYHIVEREKRIGRASLPTPVTKHSSDTSASRGAGVAGVVCSGVYNAGDVGFGQRCSTSHDTSPLSAPNLNPSSIHLKGRQTAGAEPTQVRIN